MTSQSQTLEQLAYRPFGFNAPEPKREIRRAKPNRKLFEAFEKWLPEVYHLSQNVPGWNFSAGYEMACELIKNIKIDSVEEAHALLLMSQSYEKYFEDVGLFISALYQKVPESTIVFDLELENEVGMLGFNLPKGKTLINFGEYVFGLGNWGAKGNLINYGQDNGLMAHDLQPSAVALNYGIAEDFGTGNLEERSGLLINCGKADLWDQAAGGPKINFGEWGNHSFRSASLLVNCGSLFNGSIGCDYRGYGGKGIVIAVKDSSKLLDISEAKFVLKEKDCRRIPELMQYLDRMKAKFEAGRTNYKKAIVALDELGSNPGQSVERDIKNILRGAGYNV